MSGQKPVMPSANAIAAAARAAKKGGDLPPVEAWNPPFCGDIDMRIARDGAWYHEGGVIGRPELVRLFSTILRKEGDRYFLVTPVEKVGIEVEDVPFVAVDFDVENEGSDQILHFSTNLGDEIAAGERAPIRVSWDQQSGEPAPYVMVRAGLEARIDRKSFYRMVDLGVYETFDGENWFGVRSGGVFFPLMASEKLH